MSLTPWSDNEFILSRSLNMLKSIFVSQISSPYPTIFRIYTFFKLNFRWHRHQTAKFNDVTNMGRNSLYWKWFKQYHSHFFLWEYILTISSLSNFCNQSFPKLKEVMTANNADFMSSSKERLCHFGFICYLSYLNFRSFVLAAYNNVWHIVLYSKR